MIHCIVSSQKAHVFGKHCGIHTRKIGIELCKLVIPVYHGNLIESNEEQEK